MKKRNAIGMGCAIALGLSLLGSGTAKAATINEYLFDDYPHGTFGEIVHNEITSGPHLASPLMRDNVSFTNLHVAGGPFLNSVPYHSIGMMQTPLHGGTPDGGYLAYAGGASVAGLTNLTIEMWVNPLSQATAMDPLNFEGSGFRLSPVAGGYNLASEVFVGGGYRFVGGSTLITAGTWSHIAMTYDGTTIKQYVNGTPNGSNTFGTVLATANAGYGGLVIGANYFGTLNYHGSLDEIRMSDVVLLPGAGTGLNELAFAATLVPEPTSAALLGLGGLLVWLRRKKIPITA